MRVLIADESVARSKAVRAFFPKSRERTGGGRSGRLLRRRQAAQGRTQLRGVDLADQPERGAAILGALGISLLNRGRLEEGTELIERALRIRRKVFGATHPATACSSTVLLARRAARRLRRGGRRRQRRVAHQSRDVRRPRPGRDQSRRTRRRAGPAGSVRRRGEVRDRGHRDPRTFGLDATDPNTTRLLDVRARAGSGSGQASGRPRRPMNCCSSSTCSSSARGSIRSTRRTSPITAWSRNAWQRAKEAERHYRDAIKLYGDTLDRPCHPNLIGCLARWPISARCCVRRTHRRAPGRGGQGSAANPGSRASRCAALRTFWSATMGELCALQVRHGQYA